MKEYSHSSSSSPPDWNTGPDWGEEGGGGERERVSHAELLYRVYIHYYIYPAHQTYRSFYMHLQCTCKCTCTCTSFLCMCTCCSCAHMYTCMSKHVPRTHKQEGERKQRPRKTMHMYMHVRTCTLYMHNCMYITTIILYMYMQLCSCTVYMHYMHARLYSMHEVHLEETLLTSASAKGPPSASTLTRDTRTLSRNWQSRLETGKRKVPTAQSTTFASL